MTDHDTDHDDAVRHVAELVDRAQISMFTTMTAQGQHVSRPMALQEAEFTGDLWFFAYADSAKVAERAIIEAFLCELRGLSEFPGRCWTFQIVEEYDDGYYASFRRLEDRVCQERVEGRRHVDEA